MGLRRVNKWLLPLLLLLVACDGTLFHRFSSIEGGLWNSTDTLAFGFEGVSGKHNGCMFDLCLEVRTTAAYSYRNVVMRVEAFVSGDSLPQAVDTLFCEVYDSNGRHKGSTVGLLYQVGSEPKTLSLSADSLLFKVSHIMDCDTLCGVSDVGLKLMRHKD